MEKEKKKQKRHKCSICGKVRNEIYMSELGYKTSYGNDCWSCVDNSFCQQKGLHWMPY